MNRILVGALLLIGGLLGLFMTLCGGFFSVGMLMDARNPYTGGLLTISLPSLIVGLVLLRVVWKQVRRRSLPPPSLPSDGSGDPAS
jgi:hypothetical protein